MKLFSIFLLLTVAAIVASCNKYSGVAQQQLSGHVTITDALSSKNPQPASSVPVYLNNADNSDAYVFQGKTDTAGYFNMSYPGGTKITIFTRFIRNGAEYKGQVTIDKSTGVIQKDLPVSPVFVNGLSVSFLDAGSGPIPNLPFRIYSSRVMASVDSVKFANYNSTSDAYGQFTQYNLNAAEYYIVSSSSIGGKLLTVFDSVTVSKTGVFKKNVQLK